MAVIDLDPAWKEAVEDVFPYTPLQLCCTHFERIVDRTIPKRKRTPRQHELKEMVRDVLYASTEEESRRAFDELMSRKGYFRDKKSRYVINSLKENYGLLTTHFRVLDSPRSNNIAESIIDKIEMRQKMIRGYKRARTARNSLKLIVTHYRFKPFASCKKKEHNGKSPLNLAGVDTSKMNWIVYSQTD
jgi:transposase-like protein